MDGFFVQISKCKVFTVQCYTVLYSTVVYCSVLHSNVLNSTIKYSTVTAYSSTEQGIQSAQLQIFTTNHASHNYSSMQLYRDHFRLHSTYTYIQSTVQKVLQQLRMKFACQLFFPLPMISFFSSSIHFVPDPNRITVRSYFRQTDRPLKCPIQWLMNCVIQFDPTCLQLLKFISELSFIFQSFNKTVSINRYRKKYIDHKYL